MNPIKQISARRAAGAAAGSGSARLGWLDAMRGIAALTVAMYHLALPFIWVPHGDKIAKYADQGIFGVMLFFLVSGYIVPVSLERRGDVQGFWVGRLFRLYPVLIVTVVGSMVILGREHTVVNGYLYDHPVLGTAANLTMLQDLLSVPSAISVMWTLSYEMVFYFLVTALFVTGRHRSSGPIAVGFAAVALVFGAFIPNSMLTAGGHSATRHLVTAALMIFVLGMLALLSGNPAVTRAASLLLAGLGLAIVVFNSRSTAFESMMIFATMFSGTLIYRAEQGQVDRRLAWFCCAFVISAGVLVGYMYDRGPALQRTWSNDWMSFSGAYLAAWAVFGVGFLLRKKRFPKVLTWLGAVSYSVYLLHNPLIHAMYWVLEGHHKIVAWDERLILLGSFLAALFLLCWLSYRLVELPFQNLGRKLLKSARVRFPDQRRPEGGDTPVEPAKAPEPALTS